MTEEFKDPLKEDFFGVDEMDSLLSIDPQHSKESKEPEEKKDKKELKEDTNKIDLPHTISEPSLNGSDFPSEYLGVVERIKHQYEALPKIDYNAIYNEISELSVKSNPSPTLQVLNDEIQRVQAAKDRLSEILISVIPIYNFKKRAVDILTDAWGKFTSEKNAESRRGDAVFRLSNFLTDFAESEGLLKACTHVLRNLDSIHDGLSRRITIIQLTIKLQDIGRGALPDFDFDKSSNGIEDFMKDDMGENNVDSESKSGGRPKPLKF